MNLTRCVYFGARVPAINEAPASLQLLQTEDILKTAEDIVGPYVWGRYDMVCLPPSFPFGGMENPCLTFITPTLIVRTKNDPTHTEILHH